MAKAKTTRKGKASKDQAAEEVQVERRRGGDRRQEPQDTGAPEGRPERRKVQRRRQIDPTTCERDYTDDEIEFMHAMDAYKRSSGRMFPTCSEILEVVRGLGYERTAKTTPEDSVELPIQDDPNRSGDTDLTIPATANAGPDHWDSLD